MTVWTFFCIAAFNNFRTVLVGGRDSRPRPYRCAVKLAPHLVPAAKHWFKFKCVTVCNIIWYRCKFPQFCRSLPSSVCSFSLWASPAPSWCPLPPPSIWLFWPTSQPTAYRSQPHLWFSHDTRWFSRRFVELSPVAPTGLSFESSCLIRTAIGALMLCSVSLLIIAFFLFLPDLTVSRLRPSLFSTFPRFFSFQPGDFPSSPSTVSLRRPQSSLESPPDASSAFYVLPFHSTVPQS